MNRNPTTCLLRVEGKKTGPANYDINFDIQHIYGRIDGFLIFIPASFTREDAITGLESVVKNIRRQEG